MSPERAVRAMTAIVVALAIFGGSITVAWGLIQLVAEDEPTRVLPLAEVRRFAVAPDGTTVWAARVGRGDRPVYFTPCGVPPNK